MLFVTISRKREELDIPVFAHFVVFLKLLLIAVVKLIGVSRSLLALALERFQCTKEGIFILKNLDNLQTV